VLVITGKERTVFLYDIALFIHVMAVVAMFTVIGIVMVSVMGMRRAQTVEQLQERTSLAYLSP